MIVKINIDFGSSNETMQRKVWKDLEGRLFSFFDTLNFDVSMNFMDISGTFSITFGSDDFNLRVKIRDIVYTWMKYDIPCSHNITGYVLPEEN